MLELNKSMSWDCSNASVVVKMSQKAVEISNTEHLPESLFPDFVTVKYIEQLLQKNLRDPTIKVVKLKIEPTDGAFSSSMFKTEVFYKCSISQEVTRTSFFLKMLHNMELAAKLLGPGNYNVHQKELEMFEKIFPKFEEILQSCGENKNVFPTAIAADREREVLVLKNLADTNFVMCDRPIGCDLEHTKWSLKKLARLHAASMVLMESQPEAFANFDVGMFSRKVLAFRDKFGTSMDALTAEVSTWNGFEYYAKKLEKLKPYMYEISCRSFDNEPGDLKVLAHGDFWSRNMMFTYDENGSVSDAIILDYQFCCVAHPAIDLLFFLYTSTVDEIRQTKIFELSQFYYYELKNVLTKLKYDPVKIPPLLDFQAQIMKKYFYAFSSALLNLPLMMTRDPDSCFQNVVQADEKAVAFKRKLYKDVNLQEIIKNTLPTFDKYGLLDEI